MLKCTSTLSQAARGIFSGNMLRQTPSVEAEEAAPMPLPFQLKSRASFDRLGNRITRKIGGYVMKKLFGIDVEAIEKEGLNREMPLELTAKEAINGGEKVIKVEKDGKIKKLKVKIPAGTSSGTRIRLKGMGQSNGDIRGDMYLRVSIKD